MSYPDAITTAAAIARGERTSSEVTAELLERIEERNGDLNAVCVLDADAANAVARAYDEAPSGGRLGGVPLTIKEAFDVAGLPTTWGIPEAREFRARRDSAVVERLRAAGAVVVGKTNVAQQLADYGQTANPIYGVTRNPWDDARTAGGSSGGAAAAVAAGMSYLDVGSDLAGSIRIPAAFCGVYGLRPTPGLVPSAGFQPPGVTARPHPLDHLSVLGPIARTPADLRAALHVLAGPLAASRHERLADFRVGVVLDDGPTAAVGDVLQTVIDDVAPHVASVRRGWPDGLDPVLTGATFGALLGLFFAFAEGGGDETSAEYVDAERERQSIRVRWDDYFTDVDVLLCPVTNVTAPPLDERPIDERTIATPDGDRPYDDLTAWVPPAVVGGVPTLAAPVGLAADGLPVGLQIIGPRHEEDTVLRFAELLAG